MPIDLSTLDGRSQFSAVYIGYFDRAADTAGIQFYESKVTDAVDLTVLAGDFANQDETKAVHPFFADAFDGDAGTNGDPKTFITSLYLNLFNRAPDEAGLDFWSNKLDAAVALAASADAIEVAAGEAAIGKIIIDIIEGAQDIEGGTQDRTTILNKIEVASAFTTANETAEVPYDAVANKAIIEGVTADEATKAAALEEVGKISQADEEAASTAAAAAAATAATTAATSAAAATTAAAAADAAEAAVTDVATAAAYKAAADAAVVAADAAAADAAASVAAAAAAVTAAAATNSTPDNAAADAAVVAADAAVTAATAAQTAAAAEVVTADAAALDAASAAAAAAAATSATAATAAQAAADAAEAAVTDVATADAYKVAADASKAAADTAATDAAASVTAAAATADAADDAVAAAAVEAAAAAVVTADAEVVSADAAVVTANRTPEEVAADAAAAATAAAATATASAAATATAQAAADAAEAAVVDGATAAAYKTAAEAVETAADIAVADAAAAEVAAAASATAAAATDDAADDAVAATAVTAAEAASTAAVAAQDAAKLEVASAIVAGVEAVNTEAFTAAKAATDAAVTAAATSAAAATAAQAEADTAEAAVTDLTTAEAYKVAADAAKVAADAAAADAAAVTAATVATTAAAAATASVADDAIAAADAAAAATAATAATAVVATADAEVVSADTAVSNNTVGDAFTLTINEDNQIGTANNDTFTSSAVQDGNGLLIDTLQNVDILDGKAGIDTLDVTVSQAATITPTLTSIENLDVRFTANGIIDLSGSTGVKSITVANSTSTGALDSVGAIESISVKNQNQRVNFDDIAAPTLAISLDTFGTTTTATRLDLGATTAAVTKVANITLNNAHVDINSKSNDAFTTANIEATGTNRLNFADSGATLETVTVMGGGSVDLTNSTLNAVKSFDGSTATGAIKVEIIGGNKATVITGSGNDFVEMSGPVTLDSTVMTGAGDDTLLTGKNVGNFKSIDAGDGTGDIINIAGGTLLTGALAAKTSNFEILDVSGGTGNYDVSLESFATVQIDEAINGALAGAIGFKAAPDTFAFTIKSEANDADFDLTNNTTVTLKDAAGPDALTITAQINDGNKDNGADGNIDAQIVTAAGFEAVTVDATVTTADGGTTPVAASAHTLTVNLQAANATTLNVTGDASVIFTGSSLAALTAVDASGSTGGVTLDLNAEILAVSYAGSTGVDTFTSSTKGSSIDTGEGNDVVTLTVGLGEQDTLIYNSNLDATAVDANSDGKIDNAALETITGFISAAVNPAHDIIDLTSFAFTGFAKGALNKGTIADVNGGTFDAVIADFFAEGGSGDRGVAFGVEAGNTNVFVDVNKDGDFNIADDLVIELAGGVGPLENADFNFG